MLHIYTVAMNIFNEQSQAGNRIILQLCAGAKGQNLQPQRATYITYTILGGLLWKYRFHKRWKISWAAERLSASQKRLRPFKI